MHTLTGAADTADYMEQVYEDVIRGIGTAVYRWLQYDWPPRLPQVPAQLMNPYRQPHRSVREGRHGFQQMARLPCYRGVRTR